MQIFGQVWLWSLGSFLLGVLFTWLLLVNPARKRVTELEEAATRQPLEPREPREPREAAPRLPTRVGAPVGQPGVNETDRFLDDLFDAPKPPVAQPPLLPPPPPPPGSSSPAPTLFQPLAAPPEVQGESRPQSFSSRLDPTAPPEPPIPDESDTELSDTPFRQFTESSTVFVPPAGVLIPEKPESAGQGEDWFAKEEDPDPHLITDVDDDERVDESGTIFTQHTTPIPDEMIRSLDNEAPSEAQAEPVRDYEPQHSAAEPVYEPPAEPAHHYEAPQSPAEPVHHHAAPESPAEVTHHFEAPPSPAEPVHHYEAAESPAEPVQHYEANVPAPEAVHHYEPELPQPELELTQRFEPAPAAAAAAPEGNGRSLFEPVVPVAEQDAAADSSGAGEFVPPGPFGPGSAMPLPGGGAPAPEFGVKASVTALRYCTQDNPQFDRIVAEVWFRTPSDAERVGFRVLS
ncbi:hypothetical protein [Kibdelosporangium phytohabitans]|uniref:Uncharacterized protein n=1 Tax=Kibdelosporangium phytohabitans TaxID=860235 RepID=A0A0N7F5E0_9PSEU|nr:hypothetical protein [Kibdelosporangium phytohabitans]ALG13967.1 hypothetical protein AOZ06_50200 [Kibdelosporangium phytohabitans]MBE1467087.1 hypothetical protein [Kibdelosporangium phytohabitans]